MTADDTTYAVLVTGSRNWPDPDLVYERLSEVRILARENGYRRLAVIHGGNPKGADWLAHRWCQRQQAPGPLSIPVTELRRPADWRPGGVFNPAAGFARNDAMVAEAAGYSGRLCLGFVAPCVKPQCGRPHPHGSHGAVHCLDRARRRDIPLQVDQVYAVRPLP